MATQLRVPLLHLVFYNFIVQKRHIQSTTLLYVNKGINPKKAKEGVWQSVRLGNERGLTVTVRKKHYNKIE
jgi:hypothetical protein